MSDPNTDEPLSTVLHESTSCVANTSSIYDMIPSAVRSRIPILSSLRQSARNAVTRPLLHSRSWSMEEYITPTSSSSGSRRTSLNSVGALVSTTSDVPTPRPSSPDNNGRALVATTHVDLSALAWGPDTGGVDWITAGAGVRLWLSAREQAELATRNPALLRSMHIDAVRYMNMSLPADLSTAEVAALQASIPSLLSIPNNDSHQMMQSTNQNMLRQGVARVVCWSIAVILFVVPLMMTVLNRLVIYEREHRVARRMLENSAELTKALGERGLDYGEAVLRYKDTPLGRAFLQALSWTIEGLAGGLNDGIMQSTNDRTRSREDRSLPIR